MTSAATAHRLLPDSLSDRGNAKLFVPLYGRDYRHVPGLGWYQWAGHRWRPDEDDTVLWAAGEMAESIAANRHPAHARSLGSTGRTHSRLPAVGRRRSLMRSACGSPKASTARNPC
ncbi:hypothetical protein [Kitasatospora sp. NPDC056181]|uniref:hypothetical protein n=1 Tax=Kitasatospora sp. NPDC056181 TaxID=3345737 RepID=UPI0035D8D80A